MILEPAHMIILSNLHVGTPKRVKILKLESMLKGLTDEEFEDAFKELISESDLYICRTERFVAKVNGRVRKK